MGASPGHHRPFSPAAVETAELPQRELGHRQPGAALLVVDDEASAREVCSDVAVDVGLRVHAAGTTEHALEILERSPVDIVITDLKVPALGGLELLRRIRSAYPHIPVIVLTQFGTVESAVEAMRLGAADYLTKPFHVEELRGKLERLLRSIELDQENRILREQLRSRPGFGGLVGVSPKMQKVYKLIEKVSQHTYPVLILGESGTGKELVARSIHYAGPRRTGPFVPVDCSALVPTLIESELFGYVKGAFTGAVRSKTGLMEAAHGGTLFLDEIGDLPVELQAKLLRVLQEREVRPVGSNDRVPVDVRVIAATHRDLDAAIRQGSFRQDLYFRLNVVQIKLPPLRERKSDVPLLVSVFLEKFASSPADKGDVAAQRACPEAAPESPGPAKGVRPVRTIAAEAMARLMSYDWPGNVRELENAVERAVALSSGPVLHVADLPSNLQYPANAERLPAWAAAGDELLPLEELERRAIFRALRETAGDKLAAARLLGIGKTTLYRKLKQYQSAQSDTPASP